MVSAVGIGSAISVELRKSKRRAAYNARSILLRTRSSFLCGQDERLRRRRSESGWGRRERGKQQKEKARGRCAISLDTRAKPLTVGGTMPRREPVQRRLARKGRGCADLTVGEWDNEAELEPFGAPGQSRSFSTRKRARFRPQVRPAESSHQGAGLDVVAEEQCFSGILDDCKPRRVSRSPASERRKAGGGLVLAASATKVSKPEARVSAALKLQAEKKVRLWPPGERRCAMGERKPPRLVVPD